MSDKATRFGGHERLTLQNFTAFKDCTLEFVPGINVFIGENGTGKTHAMKILYALGMVTLRSDSSILAILRDLFQLIGSAPFGTDTNVRDLRRAGADESTTLTVDAIYRGESLKFTVTGDDYPTMARPDSKPQTERPVFIPAIDMLGHSKGFVEAFREVRLDFDSTYADMLSLLALERKDKSRLNGAVDGLSKVLGGEVERESDGRYYLRTGAARFAMPMVAEGLRKIATLVQLYKNGWLVPGTVLFWDEPEVNLNPVLMDELVAALLEIARSGVQIFLATHSYVILKELDLQSTSADRVRYFAFESTPDGTVVSPADDFSQLQPNPILAQYESLYDRELTRSTGRNHLGERIR